MILKQTKLHYSRTHIIAQTKLEFLFVQRENWTLEFVQERLHARWVRFVRLAFFDKSFEFFLQIKAQYSVG